MTPVQTHVKHAQVQAHVQNVNQDIGVYPVKWIVTFVKIICAIDKMDVQQVVKLDITNEAIYTQFIVINVLKIA